MHAKMVLRVAKMGCCKNERADTRHCGNRHRNTFFMFWLNSDFMHVVETVKEVE